jgi:hypothetical protein
MACVRDIAEREHQIPISINALARAFNCTRSSVQSALGMEQSCQESEGSIPLLTTIVNNKFSTRFNKTPNKAHQSAKRRSKINVRAN